MLPHALLIVVTMSQASTPIPNQLQPNVVIQDSRFVLPQLPTSAAKALSEYEFVQKQITRGIQDLESYLKPLYLNHLYRRDLPTFLNLPTDQAKEARALVRIYHDPEFATLREEVLKAWNGWVENLVGENIVKFSSRNKTSPMHQDQRFAEKITKDNLKQITKEDIAFQNFFRLWGDGSKIPEPTNFLFEPNIFGPHFTVFLNKSNMDIEKNRKKIESINKMIPKFSMAWDAIISHFENNARILADFERENPSPKNLELSALRLKAKIRFLERIRSSQWFCNVLWAQMASGPLPQPLSTLAPLDPEGIAPKALTPENGTVLAEVPVTAPRNQAAVPPKYIPQPRSKTRPWIDLGTSIQNFLTPKSDPSLIKAFCNLYRDSRAFRELVENFYSKFPDVTLYLQRTADTTSGNLTLYRTPEAYLITLWVQELPSLSKKDHIEPWLAAIIFKAHKVAQRGDVENQGPFSVFSKNLESEAWVFQEVIRENLRSSGGYPDLDERPYQTYRRIVLQEIPTKLPRLPRIDRPTDWAHPH